ncbi:hypothetical protein EYF80_039716 [Liparis tanakae]|uniref:Uncharacterized protein n=1 Tax=Liparis tanakae TaxID=230148 RepID=A0A4Z2GA61_9TELE|nr:hypothetical protein EYF80_039716 [Liparis tanakae]
MYPWWCVKVLQGLQTLEQRKETSLLKLRGPGRLYRAGWGPEGVADGISNGIITKCPRARLTPPLIHSGRTHTGKSNYALNLRFA